MIGHIIFLFLHFIAMLFMFFGLIITIPLHIIFATQRSRNKILKKQTKIMEDGQKPDSDESSKDDTVPISTLPSKVQFPAPKVSISGSKILILILVLIVFFIIFNYLQ